VKVCFICGVEKPLAEFYAHPQMADRHLGKCKACTRTAVLAHRAAHLETIRAYDRARGALPHRRLKSKRVGNAWRAKHPDRSRAQQQANRHHRQAPACCQGCGLARRLERHHPDYNLPLVIVWLCKPCHARADMVRREQSF
jgi:hypothetical protein